MEEIAGSRQRDHTKAFAKRIVDSSHDPASLEALYRKAPESFREAFTDASEQAPDSVTLQVWRARIEYKEPSTGAGSQRLWHAIGIGLCVAALVRIPALWLGEEWYYPRLAPLWVILGLATYFWVEMRDRRLLIGGLALAAVVIVYTALLPGESEYTDSVTMALLHLPVLFWGFLGLAFTGAAWRDQDSRVHYLRYNGELLILASLIGLGGMVFSGITVALFELITPNPEEWYFNNVGLVGLVALPVAATYLYDVVFRRRTGIASVLARVFAPLFLVMTSTYLVVALVGGQNPFTDREFLIIVNGLLLVVLGMTVFSIVERGEGAETAWIDYVHVALLVVTLFVDLIALSAILFRLASYGFTPNRVVILGANLVVMVHLAWICRAYIGHVRGTGGPGIRRAVAGYLPVYVGWAAFVAFVLPLLFRFS